MTTHQTTKQLTRMEGKVHALAFSPNNEILAMGCGGKTPRIRLIQVATGVVFKEFTGHVGGDSEGGVWSVAFDLTGTRLVSGGADGVIAIWDVNTGRVVGQSKSPFGAVFGARFLTDGRNVVVCGKTKSVHLYETATAKLVRKYIGHDADVWSLSLSASGERMATGDLNGTVCVWETKTGKRLQMLNTSNRGVFAVALTPDGRSVLAGGGTAFLGSDKPEPDILNWNVETGALQNRFTGHRDTIWGMACWPNGRGFVSCDVNRRLRWWTLDE